ncbi:MAG: serine/threonine protein kinase [Planctomycetes bacterium]|nr:serine/threonine protein kinase [Planctomycetota bacterium]
MGSGDLHVNSDQPGGREPGGREPGSSESDATVIDRVCDAFEKAWRQGNRPRIEEVLASVHDGVRSPLFEELLWSELECRSSEQSAVDVHEYLFRFPDRGEQVLAVIARYGTGERAASASLRNRTESPPPEAMSTMNLDFSLREFGNYELRREIARGGMGIVFEAYDTRLQRTVALKMILDRNLASNEAVQRFHAEAEAAGGLDHPGIVPVYDVGIHAGHHYYAMGYVEGPTLSDELKRRRYGVQAAAELIQQLAAAVAYAHEHGVVHRDLKPENILLADDGQPRITDFGLAKRTDRPSQLTMAGQILGTPGYMAPEQASGDVQRCGPAVDIYALGAVLYHLLTGHPPFRRSVEAILTILEQDPIPPKVLNRRVSRDLDVICMKCLSRNPAERYDSARQLADDLQSYLDHELIQARPASLRRRALRWARHRPRLASELVTMAAFYSYHLICLALGNEGSKGSFHWIATATVLLVCAYSWVYQSRLLRPDARPIVLHCWIATDILTFTLFLIFAADGITSPLVVIYPCMIAAAALTFNRYVVWMITGALVTSYTLVASTVPLIRPELPRPDLRQTVPVAISIVVIGLVQYYVLRCARMQADLSHRSAN